MAISDRLRGKKTLKSSRQREETAASTASLGIDTNLKSQIIIHIEHGTSNIIR